MPVRVAAVATRLHAHCSNSRSTPLPPAQPSRPATTLRVIRHVTNDLEVAALEQSPVLFRSETCVVKPLAFERERAFGLSMLGSGIEHQQRIVAGMSIEHAEHCPLCRVGEVEVAVPGEDAIEPPAERQMAHVGN